MSETPEDVEHELHLHNEETHETHAETPWEIITDPAHFVAEMAFEGSFLILSLLVNLAVMKWKLRKRDKEHAHC